MTGWKYQMRVPLVSLTFRYPVIQVYVLTATLGVFASDLARCMFSMEIIATPHCRACPVCKEKAKEIKDLAGDAASKFGAYFMGCTQCVYCSSELR
jgi:hypothetical protein